VFFDIHILLFDLKLDKFNIISQSDARFYRDFWQIYEILLIYKNEEDRSSKNFIFDEN